MVGSRTGGLVLSCRLCKGYMEGSVVSLRGRARATGVPPSCTGRSAPPREALVWGLVMGPDLEGV